MAICEPRPGVEITNTSDQPLIVRDYDSHHAPLPVIVRPGETIKIPAAHVRNTDLVLAMDLARMEES